MEHLYGTPTSSLVPAESQDDGKVWAVASAGKGRRDWKSQWGPKLLPKAREEEEGERPRALEP